MIDISIQNLPEGEPFEEGVSSYQLSSNSFDFVLGIAGIERLADPDPGYYRGRLETGKLADGLTEFLAKSEAEQAAILRELGWNPQYTPSFGMILQCAEGMAAVARNARTRSLPLAYSG